MAEREQKKAAFLVRCSTNKQDYERQIDDLMQVADRFDLIAPQDNHIFGEYITGKDDTTKQDRLSIIRLRQAAEHHEFDVILVSEVSRMSRDSVSGRVYVRQFCNMGIPVYFRDKMKWTINPETLREDESFIKELGLYFDGAAEYLKSMKTQIASGRRSSLRNNQLVVGHVLLGYKKRGGSDKRHKSELIIDEEKAQMVRDIFDMYNEPDGTLKSVSLAISAKYQTRKSVSGVQQVLARPEYYTGEYTIMMNDPDKRELPEPFTITFDPIITKETYDKAKAKRTQQRSTRLPYPKQKILPLSKLIECPFCFHHYTPRTRSGDKPGEKVRMINGKPAYSWLCATRINNSGECLSHINLNGEKMETIIWDFIKKELIGYADPQKDIRSEKIHDLQERLKEAQTLIPLYEQEIAKETAKGKRAYQAFLMADDEIKDEVFRDYNDTLKEVRQKKDEYATAIELQKKKIESYQGSIAYYSQTTLTTEYIASIEDDDVEKRKIFLQLIQKIVPYGISPGVVVLKIVTCHTDDYYILLDGNQRGEKRIAHYVPAMYAVWMMEGEKLQMHERASYFILTNTDIPGINMIDIENPDHASFEDTQAFCEANGWTLPYNYIYTRAQSL